MHPDYTRPMWIDPRYWNQYRRRVPRGWNDWQIHKETVTLPVVAPLDEEKIRKIVREEMADLVNPDVPDAPPADWEAPGERDA